MNAYQNDVRPDTMVTCPYNVAHQIEKSKMQYHLEKCRKQYPNCKKVQCPFDVTHVVNDIELDYHVSSLCNKRKIFDKQLYVYEDAKPKTTPVGRPPVVKCDEDWEAEVSNSYVPDPSKKPEHIITKPRFMTRSERVRARQEGIEKYNMLANSRSSDCDTK